VVSTCRGSADYDVDLTFDWIGRARWTISLRPPVWMLHPPLDIMIEVSLSDQVLDLVLHVPTLFGVMVVFAVETTVSAPVPFFGSSLDAVQWCQEPLLSYLEEDLGPRGVERSHRGPWTAKVWPLNPPPRRSRGRSLRLFHSWMLLFFTFFDDQGLDGDEVVCPLHHLGDCGRRFLNQRPKQFGRAYAHQKDLDD
ncbi:hypothetical protein BHM03_00050168, partial [Ensete ventricosum]